MALPAKMFTGMKSVTVLITEEAPEGEGIDNGEEPTAGLINIP